MNLSENDNFSLLRKTDLTDLLLFVDNYDLIYRTSLGIDKNITFGVEIEYENLLRKKVDKFINDNYSDWLSKRDGSLKVGGEITSPILTDVPKTWVELSEICKYLKKKKVDTLRNAGGHIHVGAASLGNDVDAFRIFLKLYTAYESVLYRFVYGDKISGRKDIDVYSRCVSQILYYYLKNINKSKTLFDLKKCIPLDNRNYAINFRNIAFDDINRKVNGNTIEFRSPNATVNEIVWQNNINVFTRMIMASKGKSINEEFLNYKLKNEFYEFDYNREKYENIDLKNVMEFVDLVFDNNLDKVYFLKQYLKNYQINYGYKFAIKAKRFTKG